MQAVILAAGKGTRMKKLAKSTNKNMLKVGGKPILEYKIDALPRKITEVIFVVGYHCEHIMKHFGRYFNGRKITYVYQHNLNGTGGAVHLTRSLIKDKFLVLMGDDLYHKKDLEEIIRYDLAVLGYEVLNHKEVAVIKTDTKGNMIEIIEAPHNCRSKIGNTAVYVLNKNFFDYELTPKKPGDLEFGLPQTMAKMARDHKIKVVKAREWYQISNPDDLKEAEESLSKFFRLKRKPAKKVNLRKKSA
jgi:NDP-sugar pyrophosphorylase family protein